MARHEADGTVSRVLSRYQMLYPVERDAPCPILSAIRLPIAHAQRSREGRESAPATDGVARRDPYVCPQGDDV